VIEQLDPDAFSYFYLIAGGGMALASGYAIGLRLNVWALLMICALFGVAAILLGLGLDFSPFASIGLAALAIVTLQVGYFTAMLAGREAPRTAASDDRAVAAARGEIGPGKRGSR
jgi:hypothetical protein